MKGVSEGTLIMSKVQSRKHRSPEENKPFIQY